MSETAHYYGLTDVEQMRKAADIFRSVFQEDHWDYIFFCGPDVSLDGTFTAVQLRAIVAVLEMLENAGESPVSVEAAC